MVLLCRTVSFCYCLHLLSVIVMCIVLCHDEYIVIVVHSKCLTSEVTPGVWGRVSWYFLATSLIGNMYTSFFLNLWLTLSHCLGF